jgi:hypothetical protein
MLSAHLPSPSSSAWATIVLWLAGAGAAHAQGSTLFESDEPLVIRLEAPLRSILAARDDPEYQPSRIEVASAQGAPVTVDLRVRVRGKSRVEACDFPPLLLNFPDEQPEGSPFAGENRLKLVTHCLAGTDHEQLVRLERQIYLAHDLLTEPSFRTREVTISYISSDGGRELVDRYGFLIEEDAALAARAGLTIVEAESVDRALYDASALALLDVFQYFIGNTDWSVVAGPEDEDCCHNIVPFARPDGVLLPVPYDFDATGLVEAPYSAPSTRLRIQSVRERLYRGRCREIAELEPAFAVFTAQRTALTALLTTDADLSERRATRARRYIDEFYDVLADASAVEREFRVTCSR